MKLPRTRIEVATVKHLPHLIAHSEARGWPDAEKIITHNITTGVAWTGFARMPEGWCMAAMWGLQPQTLASDTAWFWFIATDLIHRNPFLFVRHARRIFEDALSKFPRIVAHVQADNPRAIRFLEWLGAEIGDLDTTGKFVHPVRNVTFRRAA